MAGPIKISELPLVSSSNDVDEIPLVQGGVTRKIALSNLPEGIGIAIGTDVLAEQTIGIADNNLLEVDDPAAASGQFSRFTANGLEGRTEAEFKADVNLEIGTDVQAYDATLSSLAALGTAADKIAYSTDVDTWAETPLTAAGRSLIDDASVADMRATLGAGTSDYSDPLTTRGDVLYRDSSNVTNRLPVGGANTFLGSDGTDASWSGLPSGSVIQVVNTQDGALATTTTIMPGVNDDTIPQITEGGEFMTLAITPSNTNNKLKIEVVFWGNENSNFANGATIALFQDTTANALAAGQMNLVATTDHAHGVTFTHFMVAGTTSAITFRVRAGPDISGTFNFNGGYGGRALGGVLASSITITEIQA